MDDDDLSENEKKKALNKKLNVMIHYLTEFLKV